MGFNNITELHDAWTARFAHDKPYLDGTGGRNVVGAGRAMAYEVGIEILGQHLNGMGGGTGIFGSSSSLLPPELHGQSMPVILLPHLVGVSLGVAFAALEAGGRPSAELSELKRNLTETGVRMGLELLDLIVAMAKQGAF